jgi:hypothetical protein
MFKRLREQANLKYTEVLGQNERLERELNTKRKILSDFDSVKGREFT